MFVLVDIVNSSDQPLSLWDLEPSLLECAGSFKSLSSVRTQEGPFIKGDTLTVLFHYTPPAELPPPDGALLGEMVLGLSRFGGSAQCESRFPLGAIVQRPLPFTVSCCTVPPLVCGEGADLTYTVVNHSEHVHELSVSLNPGEAFIVAGITKRVLELLPCSELTLSFHMIPTQTGNIKLPQLTMQAGVGEPYEGHGASLQELLDLSLPGRRSCFVRPRPLDEA